MMMQRYVVIEAWSHFLVWRVFRTAQADATASFPLNQILSGFLYT